MALRRLLNLPRLTLGTAWLHHGRNARTCKILGIETSCDDTGVAIVDTEGDLLGQSLFSQEKLHIEFGGILPPVARDLHVQNMDKAIEQAMLSGGLDLTEIDAVAATVKPGLPLSLAVGMKAGKDLSSRLGVPFIPIHHMEAHALTIRMVEKVDFPFLVLLISGGHSLLAVAQDVDRFVLLGKSLDDAPGEAFDKIARRLKLKNLDEYQGMNGGKAIETAAARGDPTAFQVAEPLLQTRDCNFSFAGVKNSARTFILQLEAAHGIQGDSVVPRVEDVCASVLFAVTKHILRRVQRAMEYCLKTELLPESNRHLVVSGGVACNDFIKRSLRFVCQEKKFELHVPPPQLCTDNGIMIAWNGVERWKTQKGIVSPSHLNEVDLEAKCPLGEDISEKLSSVDLKVPWIKFKDVLSNVKTG